MNESTPTGAPPPIDLTWLERQDRRTRYLLIGTGIVCGFDLHVEENCTVRLTGGVGVTSSGLLVQPKMPEYHFRYYRPYDNPDNYFFFRRQDSRGRPGDPYPVWELLKKKEEGASPLTPQNLEAVDNPFVRGKVAILYLERTHYEENRGTEDGETTDEIPPRYFFRYLVMRQEDVLEILRLEARVRFLVGKKNLDDDFIFSESFSEEDDRPTDWDIFRAQHPELRLREIPLGRFACGPEDPEECDPDDLDRSDFPEINDLEDIYQGYAPIIDRAIRRLDREMQRMQRLLRPLFAPWEEDTAGEWLDQLSEKWELYKKLNSSTDLTKHRKYYIQYFYDWCRDLVYAYHELRRELIDLVAECNPDTEAFPRHLLLGPVWRSPLAHSPSSLRHYFRQPPIYNGNAERLARLHLYHWRFLMMVRGFYLPDYILDQRLNPYCDPQIVDYEKIPDFSPVKITPGRYYDQPLGEQSIPFYYPLTLNRHSVHFFWEYFRVKTGTTDHHLSYHANDTEDSYTALPHVIRPLHYNIDRYPFFRIEGHLGMQWAKYLDSDDWETGIEKKADGSWDVDVRAQLWHIKTKCNLPFDIIGVPVDLLTTQYLLPTAPGEYDKYNAFLAELTGMEHLAGVKEGGTFIVVYDENGIAIADFSLPFRCCPEADQPEPSQERTVTGRVLRCNTEAPIAGVEVSVGAQSMTSGAEGDFSFQLLPGSYTLAVKSASYLDHTQPFTVSLREMEKDLGNIILRPALVSLQGIIGYTGRPVPGATIEITLPSGQTLSTRSEEPNGGYELPGVPVGKHALMFRSEDFPFNGDVELTITPACDRFTHDIDLGPWRVPVAGQVGVCNNVPLEKVEVAVGNEVFTVDQAVEGRFVVPLPPGNYDLKIRSESYLPYNQSFTIGENELSKNLGPIALQPNRVTVVGRIHRTGTPLANVDLKISLPSGEVIAARSDANGNFELKNVPRGSRVIQFAIPGAQEQEFPVEVTAECDRTIAVDINISNLSPGPRPLVNRFDPRVLLTERYFAALDVPPASQRAEEIRRFYQAQITENVERINEIAGRPAIATKDSMESVIAAAERIINDPDLGTAPLHVLYKSAANALLKDLQQAADTEKVPLARLAENLTNLYLFRSAINQPDKPTPGIENTLKEIGALSGEGFQMKEVRLAWVERGKGSVSSGFLDGIRNLET